MRILLLCYEYPPVGGGGGVGAQLYAEAWVAAGHDVTVLTSRYAGLPRRDNVNGVHVIRVWVGGKRDRATSTHLSMLCYLILGFIYLVRHRRRLRSSDVINTHFAIPTGPLGMVAARLLRAPNVLTIIGGDIYDPSKASSPHRRSLFRLLNGVIINDAASVVAISSDTKRRAERYYRVRRPIQVINYGFVPLPTSRQGTRADGHLPSDAYHLVAVGRLVERKGFDYLLQALALLPDDVRLLLIGDGPLRDELEQLAVRLGVAGRTTFLGYQPRALIARHLAAADCFVLSSLHEGLGIVVQEAMDAGLPIVATNEGGQVDLLRHDRNGLLVPPANPLALAEAVRTLYEDRALAAALGRQNRADIRHWYMSENCEQYLQLFQAAAPTRRGPSRSARPLRAPHRADSSKA